MRQGGAPKRARVVGTLVAIQSACLLSVCTTAISSPAMAKTPLTVFAAASLKEALDATLRAWRRAGGDPVRVAYGSSSILARQIDRAAPADIYISANRRWVAWLAARDRLAAGTRTTLLGNRLVLVAPRGRARPVALAAAPILARLGDRRLALGDPRHVPAGVYAAAALKKLGLWAALRTRLAPAANVRAALALVARGEAPLGIVYRTDAQAERRVATVATFPADSHPDILYEAAVVRRGDSPSARRLLVYLTGAAAAALFRRHGFCAPPPCSD